MTHVRSRAPSVGARGPAPTSAATAVRTVVDRRGGDRRTVVDGRFDHGGQRSSERRGWRCRSRAAVVRGEPGWHGRSTTNVKSPRSGCDRPRRAPRTGPRPHRRRAADRAEPEHGVVVGPRTAVEQLLLRGRAPRTRPDEGHRKRERHRDLGDRSADRRIVGRHRLVEVGVSGGDRRASRTRPLRRRRAATECPRRGAGRRCACAAEGSGARATTYDCQP